jgi:hypothetical protein
MKNFTNLRKIVLIVLAMLFSGITFSQLSRPQAIEMVLNTLLQNDIGKIDVYASINNRLSSQPVDIFNNETLDCPYSVNWVFFVDDNPFANWMHECRYLFVDTVTGNYQIIHHNMMPVDLSTNFERIEEINRPVAASLQENTPTVEDPVDSDIHKFAVLISATDSQWWWNDISVLYNTLIQNYGYLKENIYVLYNTGYSGFGSDLDNDGNNDIDYDASKDQVQTIFSQLSNTLMHGDQLFVFICGYALEPGWIGLIEDPIYPTFFIDYSSDELAQDVEQISCSQMTFLLSFNYSGSFKDELSNVTTSECKNRAIHCSTSADKEVYHEIYITGEKYDEYVFYWSAAARGAYPAENAPWSTSYTLEEFPFTTIPGLEDHPDNYNPDLNEDGYVQMEEAFAYADDLDTWSDGVNNYYNPYYPGEEDPQQEIEIPFTEPIMTLYGLAGEIKNNQSVTGHFIVGKNVRIKVTSTVNIGSLSEFYFTDGNSRIYVKGKLNIDQNAIFKGQDDNFIGRLRLETDDPGYELTIGNGTRFTKMGIEIGSQVLDNFQMNGLIFTDFDINVQISSLDVTNCIFSNGFIYNSHCDYLNIYDCEFTNAAISVSGDTFTPLIGTALINNCTFNHGYLTTAIQIESMPRYSIRNNTIQDYYRGLFIAWSGEARMSSITSNQIYDNAEYGISVYNSYANLRENIIQDNFTNGIELHNKSYVQIFGNSTAHYVSETQRIKDNGMYEVLSEKNSFPTIFKWNAIIDEDNEQEGYQLVYCFPNPIGILRDVRYNYWGSEANFHPQNDLYPPGEYLYLPIFHLIDGGGITQSDENLFNEAERKFEEGNYSSAKSIYQTVINQFPESKFSFASIKQLYSVEAFADNDYSSLKQYLSTNDSIADNPDLQKIAVFFANKCDVKLENWLTAIAWFENAIQNPESLEDSIYAIIDLGYTYWLMENGGLKSTYTGRMGQYKFSSREEFEDNRDYLLSLLPGDGLSETMKQSLSTLKSGQLLQNVPNPFNGTTQIWFKLAEESSVTVTVYDYTGKEVSIIKPGLLETGNHTVEFNSANLPSGIYFYSLEVNDIKTDTKKMTLIR